MSRIKLKKTILKTEVECIKLLSTRKIVYYIYQKDFTEHGVEIIRLEDIELNELYKTCKELKKMKGKKK